VNLERLLPVTVWRRVVHGEAGPTLGARITADKTREVTVDANSQHS